MQVRDVMTRSVRSVSPEDDVISAACVMAEAGLSGLPVVDRAGHVVGILTEGDLMRRKELGTLARRARWVEIFASSDDLAQDYIRARSNKVRDVMSSSVIAAEESMPLTALVRLFEQHGIKRAPVLREGALVGIVSRADLIRALALQQDAPPTLPDDAAIRNTLLQRIHARAWLPASGISFVVTDRVVSLYGVAASEEQRRALVVMGETIPGVKSVEDHLQVSTRPAILI